MPDDKIISLDDYQHSRLNTEMYFGSRIPETRNIVSYEKGNPVVEKMTWIPALYTSFRELIDNACDEVIGKKYGSTIKIKYNEEQLIFSVEDNGRGIPLDKATSALSKARTGRNFETRGEVAGVNGIGAAAVNFCSEWFKVEIKRDKKKFKQTFSQGSKKKVKNDKLKKTNPEITQWSSSTTGTKITCKLSEYVFKQIPLDKKIAKKEFDLILPEKFIENRVYELAICNPKIKFYFNGKYIKVKPKEDQNLFKGIAHSSVNVKTKDFNSRFYIIPDYLKDGDYHYSLVNNIPVLDGGSHLDAFKKTFYKNLILALSAESKRRKLSPNLTDVKSNVLIYNITTMHAPIFNSQSKTRLVNQDIAHEIIAKLTNPNVYKTVIKNNTEWIKSIYEKCAARTQKKDQKEIDQLSKKMLRNKVARLTDANGKDRSKCILFVTEGLCLEENTLIKIFNEGKFTDIKIKDCNIGDVVLTHKNKLKHIIGKSDKISKTIKIGSSVGEILATEEHRFYVYDIIDKEFKFLAVKDLNKDRHKMIKSKVPEFDGFDNIIDKIEEIYDEIK